MRLKPRRTLRFRTREDKAGRDRRSAELPPHGSSAEGRRVYRGPEASVPMLTDDSLDVIPGRPEGEPGIPLRNLEILRIRR
jgi:hypothetical protein